MLIILGGLPGSGKSSIAKALAIKMSAVYLRIDSIEQAIKDVRQFANNNNDDIGAEGYVVAYALARDNLEIGLTVIADSVNPIKITRKDWRNVALQANKPFLEVEITCRDKIKHKQRIETRQTPIPNLRVPTWQDVLDREYEMWETEHLTIDTAVDSISEAVDKIYGEYLLKMTREY